jgi:hypothetical protein
MVFKKWEAQPLGNVFLDSILSLATEFVKNSFREAYVKASGYTDLEKGFQTCLPVGWISGLFQKSRKDILTNLFFVIDCG